MSAAAHKIARRRQRAVVPTDLAATTAAGWGRGLNFQYGTGTAHRGPRQNEPNPIGMPIRGAVAMCALYGGYVVLLGNAAHEPTGRPLVGGINKSNNIPWTTGPRGFFEGLFEYRSPDQHGPSYIGSLYQQKAMQLAAAWKAKTTYPAGAFVQVGTVIYVLPKERKTGESFEAEKASWEAVLTGVTLTCPLSPLQIETLERNMELPARPDGKKALEGQIVWIPGVECNYAGQTWVCKKECVNVAPGTNEACWQLAPIQVPQFLRGEPPQFFPYCFNITMPLPMPQLANAKAIAAHGPHQLFLLNDGSLATSGKDWKYMCGGKGMDFSYGALGRRPTAAPKSRNRHFQARVTNGSTTIIPLSGVAGLHEKASTSELPYTMAKTIGTLLFPPPEAIFALPGETESPASVVSVENRELGSEGEEASLAPEWKAKTFYPEGFFSWYMRSTTLTGSTTATSPKVKGLASTSELQVGMAVRGSGELFPAGTVIAEINSGTEVTLSKNAAKTESSSILFAAAPQVYRRKTAGESGTSFAAETSQWESVFTETTAAPLFEGTHKYAAGALVRSGPNSREVYRRNAEGTSAATFTKAEEESWTKLHASVQHPAEPLTHARIFAFTLNQRATGNYEGPMLGKRAGKEYGPWLGSEGPSRCSGWPTTVMQPGVTLPGNTTSSSAKVKGFTTTARLQAGMKVNHPLFAPGTTILTVDSESQVTLSNTASATVEAAQIEFIEEAKYKAIACGTNGKSPFSMALREGGTVDAWGSSAQGQVGQGGTKYGLEVFAIRPQPVVGVGGTGRLEHIKMIACGEETSAAIDEEGNVYVWGSFAHGIGGHKVFTEEGIAKSATPILMTELPTAAGKRPTAVAISRGAIYVLCEDGALYGWGNNQKGEVGNTEVPTTAPTFVDKPTKILEGVKFICAGRFHALAIKTDGSVWTWGNNDSGELGNGECAKSKTGTGEHSTHGEIGGPCGTPRKVELGGREAIYASCSEYNSFVIFESESKIPNVSSVKLVPAGTEEGVQAYTLQFDFESPLSSGWKIKVDAQIEWWEEQLIESEIERIIGPDGESGELAEASGEEKEQLEEELAEWELEREELEEVGKGPKVGFEPTSTGTNKWRHIVEPEAGTITLNKGFLVNISNESTSFSEFRCESRGLMLSPYALL